MTREERELIVAARRWARANGWDLHHWRGCINATYDTDATLTVGYDSDDPVPAVLIWRKGAAGLFPVRSTDYPVDSVRQAVDVLCALGVLPVSMSSQWQAGTSAALGILAPAVRPHDITRARKRLAAARAAA